MTVLQMKQPVVADDIVAGLRGLADRLEAGEHDGPWSTCVVLLGHTRDSLQGGKVGHYSDHEMFGYGPRCDTFTIRGLLMTAAKS